MVDFLLFCPKYHVHTLAGSRLDHLDHGLHYGFVSGRLACLSAHTVGYSKKVRNVLRDEKVLQHRLFRV
jgi:hypothetical protein